MVSLSRGVQTYQIYSKSVIITFPRVHQRTENNIERAAAQEPGQKWHHGRVPRRRPLLTKKTQKLVSQTQEISPRFLVKYSDIFGRCVSRYIWQKAHFCKMQYFIKSTSNHQSNSFYSIKINKSSTFFLGLNLIAK